MESWFRFVQKITGYFWTTIWKDQWLIQLLGRFFNYVSGQQLKSRQQQVDNQLSYKAVVGTDYIAPVRLLVPVQYKDAVIPLSSIVIGANSGFVIGGTSSQVIYLPFDIKQAPESIQDKVHQPSITLNKGLDFQLVDGYLKFNAPLDQLGFTSRTVTLHGQLNQCYQLWCNYSSYTTLRDAFTQILGVPAYWLYKYPGAVQASWSIKLNGCNKADVLKLLGCVGNCPVSAKAGRVQKAQQNTVVVDGTQYTGTEYLLVTKGEYVQQYQPLFSASGTKLDYPKVFLWSDTIPAQSVSSLPVITDAGYLVAANADGMGVSNNILPLSGQNYSRYAELCAQRNQDQTVPYAQLPATMNPAQYIMSTVWKHSGFVIVTPSSNTYDMQLAVDFILRNIPVGSIPIVYRFGNQTTTIRPDVDIQSEVLKYYLDSINNGMKLKNRYNDFNQ